MAKKEKQQTEEQSVEAAAFTEAPASINVKFMWRGFDTMLTIRDAKVSSALKKYEAAIGHLEKMGATPKLAYNNNQAATTSGNGGEPETKICPLHHVPMKRRTGQGGDTWYSHKAINPETSQEYWCKGKAK